jgi:transcription antitermination factor NusG
MPIGTHVRVRHRDSPFYDMSGTVVEMSKSMCVSVMMSIFNRDVVVEFTNPNELEVE